MGFFGGNNDQHHGEDCRDRSGAWWAKPNPMGYGSNDARTVKRTGSRAGNQSGKPTQHGSRMDRAGGLLGWGGRIRPTGEGPGGRR